MKKVSFIVLKMRREVENGYLGIFYTFSTPARNIQRQQGNRNATNETKGRVKSNGYDSEEINNNRNVFCLRDDIVFTVKYALYLTGMHNFINA